MILAGYVGVGWSESCLIVKIYIYYFGDFMKKILISCLVLLSASSFALDCKKQPYRGRAIVGQISPTKARQFIEETDFSIDNLHKLEGDYEVDQIKSALRLGLYFQKQGNTSMVYNVDALLSMQESSDVLSPLMKILDTQDESHYYVKVQLIYATYTSETLKRFGRLEEAQILENQILNTIERINNGVSSTTLHNHDGNLLWTFSKLTTNTGRFKTKKNSVKLCESLKNL